MIEETWDFAASAVNEALGDVATWKPGTADETEIKVVFGYGFDRVANGSVRVTSRNPEIMVVDSDLPNAATRGDELEVRDLTFEVVTPKPDVEAVSTTLVLKEAS